MQRNWATYGLHATFRRTLIALLALIPAVVSHASPDWAGDRPAAADELLPRIDPIGAFDPLPQINAANGAAVDGVWSAIIDIENPAGPSRLGHTAIYDPPRRRMVVFGGAATNFQNDSWVLDFGTPAEWSPLATNGTLPSPRRLHTAIHDPANDRMIVFGGFDGGFYSDVWELSLSGTPTWTQLFPGGATPAARGGHSAIYDAVGQRMVVFGGFDGVSLPASRRDDIWELSLTGPLVWTELTATNAGPSARSSHDAIYDAANQRMVLVGGTDPNFLNDVWTLALSGPLAWTALSPGGPGPAPREEHSLVYDGPNQRLLMFGGYDASFLYGDLWGLSLTGGPTWSVLPQGGDAPGARWGHTAIVDPVSAEMVTYGGIVNFTSNTLRAFDLGGADSWRNPLISPAGPLRLTHAAVHDPVRQQVLIFGGSDTNYLNDTHVLDLLAPVQAWQPLTTGGTLPAPRRLHRAVFDLSRDRMIVFGGFDGTFYNDTWELSLTGTPTWTQLAPIGPAPSPRAGHAMILDTAGDRVIIFGGFDGVTLPSSRVNDVWELTLATPMTWTNITPASGPAPSARSSHAAVYDALNQRMIVFGGSDPAFMNDSWELSLGFTPAWQQLVPLGTPPDPREEHSAIFDWGRQRMVVFGGLDAGRTFGDVWSLSLDGSPTWVPLMPLGNAAPEPRWGHCATYDPVFDRMIMHGGFGAGYLGETWALIWDQPTPTLASLVASDVSEDGVRLEWFTEMQRAANIYRSGPLAPWSHLATVAPDGDGRIVFEDTHLPAGRYGYRLGLPGEAKEVFVAEAWVDIRGHALRFSIRPNPVVNSVFTVRFSLPTSNPATISLLDVNGRLIASRDVGALGAGSHTVSFDQTNGLAPGVYLVRINLEDRVLTRRAIVLR